MEQNSNLRNETPRRKPFIKVLVSVLVAALAAFVMIPLTSTMTRQEVLADDTVTRTEGGVINVSKVDDNGAPVKGAQLQLKDESGNVVAEWTTDGETKTIDGLAYPANYTLHEKSAPIGYVGAADMNVYLPKATGGPLDLESLYQGESIWYLGKGNQNGLNSNYSFGLTARGGVVVYCIDRYKSSWAQWNQKKLLSEVSGSDTGLSNNANISKNKKALLGAVLVGYPNDMAGIGKKYNLSDTDFNRVTQDVIWKIVNGVEPGTFDTATEDYKVHQSAEYKLYYKELYDAAYSVDTTGYDTTVLWRNNFQPVICATVSSVNLPSANVTMVDKKVEIPETSITIEKKWEDTDIDNTENLSATFRLYKNGAPEGATVTLNKDTGWTYTFRNLPAMEADGAVITYTVKEESCTPGYSLTSDSPKVEAQTLTHPSTSTTVKGLRAVTDPQIGKSYVMVVESYYGDNKDAEKSVKVLSSPLSLGENAFNAEGTEIKPGTLWTLVDAGSGNFYLKNDLGQTMIYGDTWNDSTASGISVNLANQPTGIKFYLTKNGDESNTLHATRNWMGLNSSFIFTMGYKGVQYSPDGERNVRVVREGTQTAVDYTNKVFFYEPYEKTVEVPGEVTVSEKQVFTNKKTEVYDLPTIATKAKAGSGNVLKAETDQTIKDTVTVNNLVDGVNYTLTGKLMIKDGTEKGTEVKTYKCDKKTFTKADVSADGTIEMTFSGIDASGLAGKDLVVFETLSWEGTVHGDTTSVDHIDINDTEQTVAVEKTPEEIEIKINAKKSLKDETGNAITLKEGQFEFGFYWADGTLQGKAKNKADGTFDPVKVDSKKNKADAGREFGYYVQEIIPEGATKIDNNTYVKDGVYYDATKHQVKAKLSYDTAENVLTYVQTPETVEITNLSKEPSIGTTATDAEDGDKETKAAENVQVKDVVEYKNLVPGKTYKMKGRLVKKSDKTAVCDEVTKEFTAAASGNGTVELVFTVNTKELAGEELVAFEKCMDGTNEVAVHEDINDGEQTVKVKTPDLPTVKTTAKAGGAENKVKPEAGQTIVDTVELTNLKAGVEYTITGELMKKSDAQKVASYEVSEVKFTATAEDEAAKTVTKTMEFTDIDASDLAGDSLVVYETLSWTSNVYGKDNHEVSHKDINDAAQTVAVENKIDEISLGLQLTKALKGEGAPALVDKQFEFKLELTKAEPQDGARVVEGSKWTGTDGKLRTPFKVTFAKAGNYTFTAKETKGRPKNNNVAAGAYDNVSFDAADAVYNIKVEEVDGKLVAKVDNKNVTGTYTLPGTQDNTYTKPETVNTKVSKVWVNNDNSNTWPDGVDSVKVTVKYGNDSEEITLTKAESEKTTKDFVKTEGQEFEISEAVVEGYTSETTKTGTGYIITNTQDKPNETSLNIQLNKAYEGESPASLPSYKFTLTTDSTDGVEIINGARWTKKGAAKLNNPFVVKFTKAGTYRFTIAEDKNARDKNSDYTGVEFTAQDQTIEVVVDDNIKVTRVTGADLNGTIATIATVTQPFKNKYEKPEIKTTATDSETKDHIAKADGQVTITDVVKYYNLKPGTQYTMTGQLMDKNTEEPVTGATASETFKASENGDGEVTLTFKIDAEALKGTSVVAFETAYEGEKEVAAHTDINDEAQTVHFPDAKTTAQDKADNDKYLASSGKVTVVDTVKYTNLIPGKTYKVEGTLHDKSTGKALDVAGATGSKEFTAEKADGEVTLEFEIDATALSGKALVAFEKVTYNSTEVAVHADINDADQTVYVPEIKTTATDNETKDHIANADDSVIITDVVEYKGLIPGKEYTMTGQLHKKSDGNVTVGKEVTKTFKASKSGNGKVTLEFELTAEEAKELKGESTVAFETCKDGGKEVAVHADINDEAQTVHFPEAKTNATDKADGDHTLQPLKKVTVVDRVTYTNLIPGKEYTVKGTLHDKETGEACTFKGATATKTFTAQEANGTVDLEFTFDASELKGKVLVAFEQVSSGGKVVAVHEDINDADQTVYVPEIKTTATDNETNDHVANADDSVIITDVVEYKGLIPGKEYTMTGQLHKKSDKTAVGEEVTKKFTADASGKGTVTLEFTVNASDLKGENVVAFETCKDGDKEVAVHADINDEAQTVHFPEAKTNATDKADGDHTVKPLKKVTVVDRVTYTNLIPGKEYTVKGTLHDKETGEACTFEGATAEKTFTATQANGNVDLEFTFDASALDGKTVVAFEKVEYNSKVVATHEDLNDSAQTVEVKGEKVKVTVYKKWDGEAAKSLTVQLTKNGKNEGGAVVLNAKNNWTKTWLKLPKEDADGKVYVYDVKENVPEGYTQTAYSTQTDAAGNLTVNYTNKKAPEKTKGTIATTVEAGGKYGTTDKAATLTAKEAENVTTVIDHISYSGLTKDAEYKVTGSLYEVENEAIVGDAVATAEEILKADGKAAWTITFENVTIKPGKTYVVFEKAVNKAELDKKNNDESKVEDKASHEDPTDKSQTIVVEEEKPVSYKGAIATTVEAGGKKGSEDAEAKLTAQEAAKVTYVTDTIDYTGLVKGDSYKVTGTLMKIDANGKAVSTGKTVEDVKVAIDVNGSWTVTFTNVALEAGAKYVVYEKAENTDKAKADKGDSYKHENPGDKAQTVVVEKPETEEYNGEIRTTVEAGGKKGSENAEAKLTAEEAAKVNSVTDTIDYTGLVKGDSYKVTGTLMKIDANGKVVSTGKTVEDVKVATDVNGSWTVTFTNVALEAGAKYVVYEKAENTDKAKADKGDSYKHENPGDKAQTVVVEKPEETPETPEIKIATKAELGAKSATTSDGATTGVITQILDTVSYEGLETGKTYKLVGKLMDKATQNEVDANYYTCTATEVKPTAANGTALMIFDLTKEGARALSGREIVVYEKLFEVKVNDDNTTTEEEVAKHEDITDKNQTVKVPEKENPTVEISKTAVADSAELPGAKLVITKKGSDEVLYQHTSTNQTWKVKLEPGEYTLTEITAPKGYEVAESIDFTVNENGLAGGGKVHMEDAPTPDEPKPETTEVNVKKEWDDNNDQDGKRVENIRVYLLANGIRVGQYILNSSNNWTYTFKDLPKKDADGVEFVYTVEEAEVPEGYNSAVNGFTITNTHTPEKVVINGAKTWNDANNQDGKRPVSITVKLSANGKVVRTTKVTKESGWTYAWANLPKYENGNEIKYTVSEDKVEGYQAVVSGYDIINNYTPGKTSVFVTKVWNDKNDQDGIRPESITVVLRGNGGQVADAVLNEANGWSYTFTDLPEKENGADISYTVMESGVPEGYITTVEGDQNEGFVITNTHTPEEKEEEENPTVEISKTSTTDTAELPGATLIIKKRGTDDVVKYWISGNEPHKVQLAPGEYTLTEITAPDGYEVAESIDFTVDANGLVGSEKVHMKDAPVKEEENPTVMISKTAVADSAELPGAELIIRNAEGTIVESFVSGNEPTLVQLAPGNYTLTEITAPDGYEVAETISFTVDENGLVGSDLVHMEDAPTPVPTKEEGTLATTVHAGGKASSETAAVEIDLGAGTGTVDVVDYIVYTNLKGGVTYTVTGQLMKIVDGKAVEVVAERTYDYTADASGNGEWVMVIGDVTVEQDTKYVVFETAVEKNVAEGETPETIEHKDEKDKAQTVVVKPYVEGTEVEISKQDATTKEELPGAQLIVKDASGAIVAEWTSGTTPHMITLKPGNYTLTEITAPDGYLKAETIAFTVDESGLVGSEKVVMLDDKASNQNVKNSIGTDVTAEKVWTTEWPEGVNVTFTLQYFADGEWKTYYKDTDVPYTVTIAKGEIAVFENLPLQINEVTAKYRVVEAAVDGYNVKEWKATDIDNLDGTMSVTNQPSNGDQKTVPGGNTVKEQTNDNEKPSSGTGEKKPQNDNNGNNNNNNNGGDNNTGITTPAPGRTTSGGYPTTPVTTRRTGTYATSTPSVSSSTATSTGDTNNAALWIVLAAAASAAIAGAAFGISRRRRHEG